MAAAETERRPLAILLVYIWDALLATLAFFGALAAFGGQIDIGGRTVDVPTGIQVLTALQGAAYVGALVIVMVFLTRHLAWIRRAQIAVLLIAIAVGGASLGIRQLLHHDVDPVAALSNILFLLVDAVCVVAMTGPRVIAWYSAPGRMPGWVRGTIALWAAGGIAIVVAQAFL